MNQQYFLIAQLNAVIDNPNPIIVCLRTLQSVEPQSQHPSTDRLVSGNLLLDIKPIKEDFHRFGGSAKANRSSEIDT